MIFNKMWIDTRTFPQFMIASSLHTGCQHVCRRIGFLRNEFLFRLQFSCAIATATIILVQYAVQCLNRLSYLFSANRLQTTHSHTITNRISSILRRITITLHIDIQYRWRHWLSNPRTMHTATFFTPSFFFF